jgi:hypothetical protein
MLREGLGDIISFFTCDCFLLQSKLVDTASIIHHSKLIFVFFVFPFLFFRMDVTADHEEETGGIVTDGVEECPVETEALHRVSLFSCGTFHPAGLFVSSNLSRLEN